VGVLTGLVGIGGGFLVVPALVLFAKMPIRNAIGTSLAVIAMNALSGAVGYLGQASIDWVVVSWFTAIASLGMIIGTRLSPRLPAPVLRRAFALLLLLLAVFMIWQHATSP
ncbi:MAG: sulfite exporter TauE/SafE family protein, partial [Gemmatimonadaceae bacterium]|nr:sulfite exporter TauE/SafE family protein [Gemmatimonadaceae bacterium]